MKTSLTLILFILITISIKADTEADTPYARLSISSAFALKTLKAIEDGDLDKAKGMQDVILLGSFASLKKLYLVENSPEARVKVFKRLKPVVQYIREHPKRFPSGDLTNDRQKWIKSLIDWYEGIEKSHRSSVSE